MEKKTYSEKLRDPRWQKKRLEVMQRDGFSCQSCQDTETTLNVHHCYYERGKDVWDYPSEALITLCEGCHNIETFRRKEVEADLLDLVKRKGFLYYDMIDLSRALFNLPDKNTMHPVFINALGDLLREEGFRKHILDTYFEILSKNKTNE